MSAHVSTHVPTNTPLAGTTPANRATSGTAVAPTRQAGRGLVARLKAAAVFVYEVLELYGEAKARRTLAIYHPELAARLLRDAGGLTAEAADRVSPTDRTVIVSAPARQA